MKIFGVDIAHTLGAAMGPGLPSATLVKVTPGSRLPGSLADGTGGDERSYPCKVVPPATRQSFPADGPAVVEEAVTVAVLGATLPAGVTPGPGDRLVFAGVTYEVATADVDPAGAAHALTLRSR